MCFRSWLEGLEKAPPAILFEGPNIPWEVWRNWKESIELFLYDHLLDGDGFSFSDFQTARARGIIRVFDVPSLDNRVAILSLRKTGRIDDAVNGAVVKVPQEEISRLGDRYPGYHMGTIPVVIIDPVTGLALKKKKIAFYLFNPQRVVHRLQPLPGDVSKLTQIAYGISTAFGDELVRTTFRLPKRGKKLVKITR